MGCQLPLSSTTSRRMLLNRNNGKSFRCCQIAVLFAARPLNLFGQCLFVQIVLRRVVEAQIKTWLYAQYAQ